MGEYISYSKEMKNFNLFLGMLIVVVIQMNQTSSDCVRTIIPVKSNPSSGKYLSPDKQFFVSYQAGDGAISDQFKLFSSRKRRPRTDFLGIKNLGSVHGFIWIPKHPHTLVFSVTRSKGKPFIAIWSGTRIKLLKIGNRPANADEATEFFNIIGFENGSKKILYRHFDVTTHFKERLYPKSFQQRHSLVIQ